jgi:hypothetical protein
MSLPSKARKRIRAERKTMTASPAHAADEDTCMSPAERTVWANGDLFRCICDALHAGDIFTLECVSKGAATHCVMSLRSQRYLSKRIIAGLMRLGATDAILKAIIASKALIAGSIVLQILLGLRWEPTDIDVFVDGLAGFRLADPDEAWASVDLFEQVEDVKLIRPGCLLLRELLNHVAAYPIVDLDTERKIVHAQYVFDSTDSVFYEESSLCVDTVRTFSHNLFQRLQAEQGQGQGKPKLSELHARRDIVPWQVVSVACDSKRVSELPYHAHSDFVPGTGKFANLSRLHRHLLGTCDLEFLKSYFDGRSLTIWCKQALRLRACDYQVGPMPIGCSGDATFAEPEACRNLVTHFATLPQHDAFFKSSRPPTFAISRQVALRIARYRGRGFTVNLCPPPSNTSWRLELAKIEMSISQREESAATTHALESAFVWPGCCWCNRSLCTSRCPGPCTCSEI